MQSVMGMTSRLLFEEWVALLMVEVRESLHLVREAKFKL